MLSLDKTTWDRVKFGEVIQSVTDRVNDPSRAGVERYVGLEHVDPGVLTVQRWDDPSKVSAQKLLFKPGDVVFGRRRAYQKKVARAGFDGICSAHALVLRAIPGKIEPDFLPVFLSSNYFLDRAIGISVGSLSPTVNWRDLKAQEFDLPPLDEQKRIADLLWAVERQRDALLRLSEKMRLCRRAEIDSLVSSAVSTRPIPLAEVAEVRGGLAKGKAVRGDAIELPYLRVANVKNGELDLAEVKQIRVSTADAERFRLEPGDVLMTEGGDIDKLGRGTVWQGEIPYCLHQNHVFAVRADPSLVRPYWIAIHSESAHGRDYFLTAGKKTSNLASVNKTQVSAFPIGMMSLTEQDECLARVGAFDETVRLLERELRATSEVRDSLLSSIFGDS